MKARYQFLRLDSRRQGGAAAVEFALVAMALFFVLFGIMEFGRYMYVGESIQEITRRAARTAVVTSPIPISDLTANVKTPAILGGATYPAAAELTAANISIQYLNPSGSMIPTNQIPSPTDNIAQCQIGSNTCIASVRISMVGSNNTPQVQYLRATGTIAPNLPLPLSTVTMPAESMGFTP